MNYEEILEYQDMIDAAFESDDGVIASEAASEARKLRNFNASFDKIDAKIAETEKYINAFRKMGNDIFDITRLLRKVHEKKDIVTARKTLLALFEWARSNEGQNGQPDEIYECVESIRRMFAKGISEEHIGRAINKYARYMNGQTGSWYTTSAAQRDKYKDW